MIIRMPLLLMSILLSSTVPQSNNESGYTHSLYGSDPVQWVNLYNIPDEWSFSGNELRCSGKYSSSLRTRKIYADFTLDVEFIPEETGAQPLLIIHSDALPAMGKPFPDGFLIGLSGKKEGMQNDMSDYQIPVADLYPPDINQIQPGKAYAYHIRCKDGMVTLTHNRKEISRRIPQKTGYITIFSPSAQARFRNILISSATELPLTAGQQHQNEFVSLYDGHSLSKWEVKKGHAGHWKSLGWLIDYDGRSQEKDKCLWSRTSYRDFELIADLKLTRKPEPAKSPVILPSGETAKNPDGSDQQAEIPYAGDTGIYLRGNSKSQVNIGNRYIGSGEIYGYRVDKSLPASVRAAVTPPVKADHAPGEWNRFIITMKGDRVTVVLNGKTVIDNAKLPGIPETGPIALQDDHADNNTFRFANLFIRILEAHEP